MTDYFLRESGADGNDGLSKENAKGSLEAAIALLGPGDTLYIGAGWYVGVETSGIAGTSGNPIRIIGDVRGRYTDDPGIVVISPIFGPTVPEYGQDPDYAIKLTGASYIEFRNLMFSDSGDFYAVSFINADAAPNEILFDQCSFNCIRSDDLNEYGYAIALTVTGEWTVPINYSLKIERCFIGGQVGIFVDESAIESKDIKFRAYNNIIWGINFEAFLFQKASENTFLPGGAKFAHNTFHATSWPIRMQNGWGTPENPITLQNNAFNMTTTRVHENSTPDNAIVDLGGDRGWNVLSFNSFIETGGIESSASIGGTLPVCFGGIGDALYYKHYGYSPYRFMEPIVLEAGGADIVDGAVYTGEVPVDFYGRSRPLSTRTARALIIMSGVTDPNSRWGVHTNAGVWSRSTAVSTTDGSNSLNYLQLKGPHADYNTYDASFSVYGAEIVIICSGSIGDEVLGVNVYTSGQTEQLLVDTTVNVTHTRLRELSPIALSEPAGGWSSVDLEDLEVRIWKVSGTELSVSNVRLALLVTNSVTSGAVETRTLPVLDAAEASNLASVRFDGGGLYEIMVPVPAAETTITVQAKTDSNYLGIQPEMQVSNIPGGVDTSVFMTGSDDVYNEISSIFTPTYASHVRVRLISHDVSGIGKCWFDALNVA